MESAVELSPLETSRLLRLPFPLFAAISLRSAGDMGKSSNGDRITRNEFLRESGVEGKRCATAVQVHSRNLLLIDSHRHELVSEVDGSREIDPTNSIEADGIVLASGARASYDALGVTVADCLPLYLFDHGSGALALLHSGWKGTGILARAVELLQDRFAAAATDIELLIGPGIGSCCYRVDRERAELVSARFGEECAVKRDDGWYLDLREANLDIARSYGIGTVRYLTGCTCCTPAFHSFRRDGAERYGHMLAVCRTA